MTAEDDQPLQYTHSGRRYLLGYGTDFFGIWDRQDPSHPLSRFPRTDEGWRAAWLAFSADEPHSVQVGLGPEGAGAPGLATSPPTTWPPATSLPAAPERTPQRRVSGAWWLLPIFMGWLGGLIAWLVNKDVDPRTARAMLITGIVISVALFLLFASTFARIDEL